MRRKVLPSFAILFLLAGFGLAQDAGGDFIRVAHSEPLPASLAASVASLEVAQLTRHLAFLTDPRREGRGLGTRGLEATVRVSAEGDTLRLLEANREDAMLYKKLATLVTDVPLPETLAELEFRGVPRESFEALCEQLASKDLRTRPVRWRGST